MRKELTSSWEIKWTRKPDTPVIPRMPATTPMITETKVRLRREEVAVEITNGWPTPTILDVDMIIFDPVCSKHALMGTCTLLFVRGELTHRDEYKQLPHTIPTFRIYSQV